jgi:hypothetical protein
MAGFALPLLNFMTCPLRKLSAATLPLRKSWPVLGWRRWPGRRRDSMAPVSLTWFRPFSSTMAAGVSAGLEQLGEDFLGDLGADLAGIDQAARVR